jgi:AcrR family transcriptional regulator
MAPATTPAEHDRAQQRRHQVLDAAARCFRLYGFHGCSMAQLAKEADMSVGHIYHYFNNKEAIIEAIVLKDLDDWLASIAHLQHSEQVYEDLLATLDRPVRDTLEPTYAALQIEILAEAARNAKVGAIVHDVHRRAREVVSEILLKGSPRPLTESEIAGKVELLGALFDGLMVRTIRAGNVDRENLLAVMRPTIRFILDYRV